MTDHLEFQGRTAIVTGAAGGVGRATVDLLLERGANVVAHDLDPAVRDLSARDPERVAAVVADETVAALNVATALERFGRLDVLVNNAGRTLNKPLVDTTVADWDRILTTHARGAFVQSSEAMKAMQSARRGSIVTVASYTATVALPEAAAYTASKGAISQLMKVVAVEGAPGGIRANAVAPASSTPGS